MTRAEYIFDGHLLQARLWLPDQFTTAHYVTLRQRDPEPGQSSDRGLFRCALTAGLAHLHVESRWNDWFLLERLVPEC